MYLVYQREDQGVTVCLVNKVQQCILQPNQENITGIFARQSKTGKYEQVFEIRVVWF